MHANTHSFRSQEEPTRICRMSKENTEMDDRLRHLFANKLSYLSGNRVISCITHLRTYVAGAVLGKENKEGVVLLVDNLRDSIMCASERAS